MAAFLDGFREWLYPREYCTRPQWSRALVALVLISLASLCVRVEAERAIHGVVPVPGSFVWALVNLHLGLGVSWELASPRHPETAALPRARRASLALLAGLALANSLVGVWGR